MSGHAQVVQPRQGIGRAFGDEAARGADGSGVSACCERRHGIVGVTEGDAEGVVAAIIITLINWIFGIILRPRKD